MYCLFCDVLCIVCVCMCTALLPPGGYPIAVKYIIPYNFISYIISYHIYGVGKTLLTLEANPILKFIAKKMHTFIEYFKYSLAFIVRRFIVLAFRSRNFSKQEKNYFYCVSLNIACQVIITSPCI